MNRGQMENEEEAEAENSGQKGEPEKLSAETAGQVLNTVYDRALSGIPKVDKPIEELAEDYLSKHDDVRAAAKDLVNKQVAKCGASGFVTGLGGLITLPVAVSADLANELYVQLRMLAAIAYMGGFDIRSDQVRTWIYLVLVNSSVENALKDLGVQFGNKAALAALKKVPGAVLVKINQKVGFRFLTKFGEKGLINLGKVVPVVGGVIGGGVNIVATKAVGKRAVKEFLADVSEPVEVIVENEPSDKEEAGK